MAQTSLSIRTFSLGNVILVRSNLKCFCIRIINKMVDLWGTKMLECFNFHYFKLVGNFFKEQFVCRACCYGFLKSMFSWILTVDLLKLKIFQTNWLKWFSHHILIEIWKDIKKILAGQIFTLFNVMTINVGGIHICSYSYPICS